MTDVIGAPLNGTAPDQLALDPLALDEMVPGEIGISDEELTALALAADPSVGLSTDAVPLDLYLSQLPGSLPSWYMPAARARNHPRWRPVVIVLIFGFLLVDAFGLCATYGTLGIA